MPYLVMDILGDYPGIPGLFVAAAYSGTLRSDHYRIYVTFIHLADACFSKVTYRWSKIVSKPRTVTRVGANLKNLFGFSITLSLLMKIQYNVHNIFSHLFIATFSLDFVLKTYNEN